MMKVLLKNEIWMKAAVAGSLWAAFEIVIGSFLHNLHFPITGMVMASAGVVLMVSFSVMWNMKDIFWRAGVVCALMKSISPSTVILGPMAGIMLEAVMMQIFVTGIGPNILGYLLGGLFALLSLVLHKATGMLLSYGFDFIIILENMVMFALKVFDLKNIEPVFVLYFYMGILGLLGFAASLFGYFIGNRAKEIEREGVTNIKVSNERVKEYKQVRTRGVGFLFGTVVIIISGLFFVSTFEIWKSVIFVMVFLVLAGILYPQGLKPLLKPSMIFNFMVLISFSIFFFDYKNSGIRWTLEGSVIGLKMFFRAVMVLVGFSVISVELRNPIIKKFMNEKSVVYGAVQTGFSILPSLISGLPSVKSMVLNPIITITMRVAEAGVFINMNLANKVNPEKGGEK